MNDWFTIEQIDVDTYAISEYKHWEETHCYLLCGTDKAILIDTGLGVANIREVVDKPASAGLCAVIPFKTKFPACGLGQGPASRRLVGSFSDCDHNRQALTETARRNII